MAEQFTSLEKLFRAFSDNLARLLALKPDAFADEMCLLTAAIDKPDMTVSAALLKIAEGGNVQAAAMLQVLAFQYPDVQPLVLDAIVAVVNSNAGLSEQAVLEGLENRIRADLGIEVAAGNLTKVVEFKTGDVTYAARAAAISGRHGHATDPAVIDVRKRVQISKIAGRYTQLKRQGREMRGKSPFVEELHQCRFYVNDEHGFFHDFSSGNHGDVIDLMMALEGLSFDGAMAKLQAIVQDVGQ